MTTLAHPPVTGTRRWAGLAVLAASLLVVVVDMTVLNVALPEITLAVDAGPVAQLWIVDAYSLVLAGLLVPVAAIADRWGRRRTLLCGFTLFGAASAAVVLAETPGAVIAIRLALGVGGAMIMPATLSLLRALFPDPTERAFALGIWSATAAAGAALGPLVGGLLLEVFGWHAAFLVNVPIMAVAVVAGWCLLPESRSERPGRVDATGVLLSLTTMSALVFAAKHVGEAGVDLVAAGLVALGTGAGVAFVRRCLRQPDPMLAVRLFGDRVFRAGVITALVSSVALTALLLVGAQWLQLVRGFSPLTAGVALLPLALGGLVGPPLAPALARRVGVRPVLVGGLLALALGMLILVALPRPMSYAGVGVALLVVGVGTAALGLASALIMGAAPEHEAGSAAAVEEMSYEIGAVLGVSVLGSAAGAVYRAGLPADAPAIVGDSVGHALGTSFAAAASEAFTVGFAAVGLLGGLAALAAAVVVHRQLPADLDLSLEH
ncbi:MAG TPA: MFS transporter [Nocardioides sp.]|uniref:MFS transporter n=1 Tax=Nocardioides sp. TaxID=35761 RepID=UPI002EDAAB4D